MSELTNIHPETVSVSRDSDSIELGLYVSENLDCFKGHFPQAPILPGVVQLDWAINFTTDNFNLSGKVLSHVEVLKYKAVIVPGSNIILSLQKKTDVKYIFKISSDSQEHASGRLVFKDLP